VKPCVFVGPLQIVETLGVRLESSSWSISQFHASPPGLLGIRFQHGLPARFRLPFFACCRFGSTGTSHPLFAQWGDSRDLPPRDLGGHQRKGASIGALSPAPR
jgi:hypothetical protein